MTAPQDAVRRRHVFYVPGYDPRDPRMYFLLFRRELALWAERNGVEATLTRETGAERRATTWRLSANGSEGAVETTLDFLGWDDLSGREFAMGYGRRFTRAMEVFGASLLEGTFWRMMRTNWMFGLFALYPFVMAAGFAAVAALWTAGCLATGARVQPAWAGWPAALAVAAAGLYGWWRLIRGWEPQLYVFYLLNAWIWTGRHRRGLEPDADARFEAFARHVAAVAERSEADELLLVGHSSGSFVAAIVAARALELSPALGRRAPFGFLTVGANTLISAAAGRRGENPAREAIARLLTEPRVRWIEYFSPNEVMSFPRLDYRRCYGVDLAGRAQVNPVVRSACMSEIFTPQTWGRLDWRFYEKHFQFLRANERPGEYDFYRFLAGSERFGARLESAG